MGNSIYYFNSDFDFEIKNNFDVDYNVKSNFDISDFQNFLTDSNVQLKIIDRLPSEIWDIIKKDEQKSQDRKNWSRFDVNSDRTTPKSQFIMNAFQIEPDKILILYSNKRDGTNFTYEKFQQCSMEDDTKPKYYKFWSGYIANEGFYMRYNGLKNLILYGNENPE